MVLATGQFLLVDINRVIILPSKIKFLIVHYKSQRMLKNFWYRILSVRPAFVIKLSNRLLRKKHSIPACGVAVKNASVHN